MESSTMEPMFALLEIMLRSLHANQPKVKPGGHADDIFMDKLSDDEREELECSICYMILKDVRQCENKHKFCYPCIFTWSTSGHYVNHGRCPVCRVEGSYEKNTELDDIINAKLVKCSLKTCRWKGTLKNYESHQHTNYATSSEPVGASSNELPSLHAGTNDLTAPPNTNPARSRSHNSQNAFASSSQTTVNSESVIRPSRQPLTNTSNNSGNTPRSVSVNQRQSNTGTTNTNRTRTRSRVRQSNSTSPQRRTNVTATGLPTRLTSRARILNDGTDATATRPRNQNENRPPNNLPTDNPVFSPHPPTTPRQRGQVTRRLPTLPNLTNDVANLSGRTATQLITNRSNNDVTDSNNNVNETDETSTVPITQTPRRYTVEAAVTRRQAENGGARGFGVVRDRLNESRQRLDLLMNAFSSELDRGRNDLTEFQQERERRRQEQLAEVRDLGRRLGHVATELRGLLTQRREIRHQIDNLTESSNTGDSD